MKNLAIIITGFCVAAVLIYQNVSCDNYFLFRAKNENGRVNDYIAGSDCIVLTNGPTIQNLVPYMLIDADDVFLSLYTKLEYTSQKAEFEKLADSNDRVYLLFDSVFMMPRTEDNSSEQSYEYSYPLNSIEGNGNVLLGADFRKEVLDYFENMYGVEAEYCTSEYVGLCPFELYRLKPSCASE